MGTETDGRYQVLGLLGEGGMGEVHRVRDTKLHRDIALKRLRLGDREGARKKTSERRFRREFHTLASLRHPRIVEAYDYGVDAAGAYYTMELLDGHDLRDRERVPVAFACSLLRDVASGLALLHARSLLHRDLAPRNVRCTSSGRAKLIDFGVMCTFGLPGDLAGTPPMVAPESLRRLPLGPRTDIFGLGSLAYWILTGRYAYPAPRLDDLEALWKQPPPPIRGTRSDVSPELEQLIMSMMSLDPRARPRTASDVIQRLSALADLPPGEAFEVSRSWLSSTEFIGRERELACAQQAMRRSAEGKGRSVLMKGLRGMGRSRLLTEAMLAAKTSGFRVLKASGETDSRGPFGVVRALATEVMSEMSSVAHEAAGANMGLLGLAIPELATITEAMPPAPIYDDPGEQRLALSSAVVDWFMSMAAHGPLALVVDDVHQSDDASAGVLATLAHQARGHTLVVLTTQRQGEPPRAAAAIKSLAMSSEVVPLARLSPSDVDRLTRGIFGELEEHDEVAAYLTRNGEGSPLSIMELAQHLASIDVLRYDSGRFRLTRPLDGVGLPRSLAAVFDASIHHLEPEARLLADAVALVDQEVSLDVLAMVVPELSEGQVFAAINTLVRDRVLVGEASSFRFRHEGLREALRRALDSESRAVLHLRIADAMLASGRPTPADVIAEHLVQARADERALPHLESAAASLAALHAFRDSIPVLEHVLRIKTTLERPRRELIEARHAITRAGVICDRSAFVRHAEALLSEVRADAGLDFADRAKGLVGARLGIGLGLAWAGLRGLLKGRQRGLWPVHSLNTYIALVGYLASVHSLDFDIEGGRRAMDSIRMLSAFKGRIQAGAYGITRCFNHLATGRFVALFKESEENESIFVSDRLTPIAEVDRRMAIGALVFMRAGIKATLQDPSHGDELDALKDLGVRFFEIAASVSRQIFHRARGEESVALAHAAEANVLAAQLGGSWVNEVQIAWTSALAYGHIGDSIGLAEKTKDLTRLAIARPSLNVFAWIAEGELSRLRGQYRRSVECFHSALDSLHASEKFRLQVALSGLAEAHLASGDAVRAAEVADRAFGLSSDPANGTEFLRLRSGASLAVARGRLGDVTFGTGLIEELLEAAQQLESPVVTGRVLEARAELASMCGDAELADACQDSLRSLYESTGNEALIARVRVAGDLAAGRKRRLERVVTSAHTELRDGASESEVHTDVADLGHTQRSE